MINHDRAVVDSNFAGRARRTEEEADEMREITRYMTVMKWMIGLQLATLVMLPDHPVHQPAHQPIPDAR
ncbi:MAG: hypothetical protein POH28_06240 [Acidocella sp.]|nr:hypothetical protein [Acidocella sp.]